MWPPPFYFGGRTWVNGDRMKIASAAVAPATGAGVIALFRLTTDRPSIIGYCNSGGSGAWRIGRQATTASLMIRNAAGSEAAHPSYVVPLNAPIVAMGYSAGATEHYLAAETAATFAKVTTSVTLETTNSLLLGTSDNTAPIGNFVGQAYWIGALEELPPLDLLDQVLRQTAPPTILMPWLAHLVALRGSPKEYCLLTGREMTIDVGAGRTNIGAPQPQIVEDEPPVGRLIRQFRLNVSHGGNNQTSLIVPAEDNDFAAVAVCALPASGGTVVSMAADGGEAKAITLPAGANAQSGNLVVGAGNVNGTAQSEAGSAAVSAIGLVTTSGSDAPEQLERAARTLLAPVVTLTDLSGSVDDTNTTDIASYITDPSGYGYDISIISRPDDLDLSVSGSVLTYRGTVVGGYAVVLAVVGRHPMEPSAVVPINILLSLGTDRYANGFRYRRRITRLSLTGVPGSGTLTSFPLPIRINGAWAATVANGGKLQGGIEPDFRVERLDGTLVPFSVRPNYNQATGVGVIDISIDWDPSTEIPITYLYYGNTLASPLSRADLVWADYRLVWEGGINSRNPADASRPWSIADLTSVAGELGEAGDFSEGTGFAQTADASILNDGTKLDLLVVCKRDAVPGQRGMLGAGDLTSDATAKLTLRDAKNTTPPDQTIRFFVETTGGRVDWRSQASRQTTSWQTIALTWSSGAAPVGYLDGVAETNSWPTIPATPIAGNLSLAGPLAVGVAAGSGSSNNGFGPWTGLIDEIRIGTAKSRSARWRFAEHASISNAAFAGLGAEETPGGTTVTVYAVDDEITATYKAGGSVLIDVLANDRREPTGPALSIQSASAPSVGGDVAIVSNKLQWTYPTGHTGAANGLYVATDGQGNVGTGNWKATINAAVSGAYNWGYPFPRADAVTLSKIKIWTIGQALPDHDFGDIILGVGPNAPLTGDEYEPSGDIKGSLVVIGLTHYPTPYLYGEGHTPANPYRGINHLWNLRFHKDAVSHAAWLHEDDQSAVNWPFFFFANIKLNYQVNGCNFGDWFRPGIKNWQTNDPTTHRLRGPKCATFHSKIYYERGPHYADNEVQSDGSQYNPVRGNRFHTDGIQIQSGNPVVRVSDSYYDWIMGQNFFGGTEASDCGFPRTARVKFKNVSWKHALPWNPNLPSKYNPDTVAEGNLARNPRMVMTSEGNFSGSPYESDDYENGLYWPKKFEGNNYILSKWPLSNTENKRYLAPSGNPGSGVTSRPTSGSAGNFVFSTDKKGDNAYPAYEGNLRLIAAGGALPETCPPDHAGYELRVTTAEQLMSILQP